MALWDEITKRIATEPKFDRVTTLRPVEAVQTRDISVTTGLDLGAAALDDLLLRVQGITTRPWRAASVRDAMGTPAIFRAVSLISNTTGSLAVETFRNGARMADDDVPRLVKRPDPFRTPRAFYRDCAYYPATRGELWWWIAKRDVDGLALSLIVMPPWEVSVEQNERDRLRPTIRWRGVEMNRDDVRLITFMPDESSPAGPFQRGVGPLQLCGAAVSVAVEAQEWAANFYAGGGLGGQPIIKSATELGEDEEGVSEADTIREQWMARDNNTPGVIDPGIEDILWPKINESGAQMLDARNNENGNAARMFGIPGSLLEYQQSGSSLTYQNLEGEFTKFVKVCLAPGYLEPIEQEMTDLLTRSTVARFNVKGFLRADAKTRWETYQIAVAVLGQEEAASLAREQEGLAPGDVEFAPVPFAPPQAVPDRLPIDRVATRTSGEVRCDGTRLLKGLLKPCNAKLAEAGPFIGTCWRCGKQHGEPETRAEFSQAEVFAALVDHLPVRIAAAMPAPVVNIPEGAVKVDIHMPPEKGKRIERDSANNITRIVPEEASDGVVA